MVRVTCAAMVPICGRLGCSRGGREDGLSREREEQNGTREREEHDKKIEEGDASTSMTNNR